MSIRDNLLWAKEVATDQEIRMACQKANAEEFIAEFPEGYATLNGMARDLRLITTTMKITTDLERMGDLAVNIAERAIELNNEPQLKPFVNIPKMAEISREMLRASLDAFTERDVDKAYAVGRRDDAVDELQDIVNRGDWVFNTGYGLLIIFFTFFYTNVDFQPVDVAEDLKKQQANIPGIRPGKQTAEFIDHVMQRITFAGAIYVAFICGTIRARQREC